MIKYCFAVGLIVWILLIFSCTPSPEVTNLNRSTDRIATKHEPSDEFFMQRAYPDGQFSIKAYAEGLAEAKQIAQSRSVTAGFEEEWTVQGPGNIGARVNTIAVHPTNENIIYAGFAGGGVFKTIDGGANWNPIFDDQLFLAIGDITIDPSDPETIYVGTGDPNISGYPKIGNGVFKSTDGGESWENIGLEAQRIVSKIIVHPSQPNTIFVSTMGLPFTPTNQRGLYKTTDGGENWNHSLYLSDTTGVIDMVMHPTNPDILYAAGWDRIRNNTVSFVSGLGAKVYKSVDGGGNWVLIQGGLPNDQAHSRIGLAIAESNPDVVYVQYISADNLQLEAIYRTDDGGTSWNPIPTDENDNQLSSNALGGFGWYFGKIRVNPLDENDIYMLGVDLWRTRNAGQQWEMATPPWWEYTVHADKHDLHFLPSSDILLTTDGGIYKTDANNQNWTDIENIPTTQFYRVAYNPHAPDLYYGGAQDNGSTGGNKNDINNWERIYGGDGFQMAFDTENPERFFVETQNGNINVTLDGGFDFESGDDGISNSDRKNWDMPYMISPNNNNILFAGTHKVYMGTGDIPQWAEISEDLTDGTDLEHRYHNITTLDESSIDALRLYAGTGDGNVWTTSPSFVWKNITGTLPDQYVTDVVASPTDANTVYVTHSGYRDDDNLARIHKSTDLGNQWEDISGDLPDLAINEVLVLPEYQDSVLFVATDGGIYGTTNSGETWNRLGTNMPFILVFDMVWNETKNELVAGTFARSIMSYPLDSIVSVPDTVVVNTQTPIAALKKPIKVYPTLANQSVTIEMRNIEPGRNFEMVIVNEMGQLVRQEKINGRQGQLEIDVRNWAAGNYFVKVKMRHEIVTERFVVGR